MSSSWQRRRWPSEEARASLGGAHAVFASLAPTYREPEFSLADHVLRAAAAEGAAADGAAAVPARRAAARRGGT